MTHTLPLRNAFDIESFNHENPWLFADETKRLNNYELIWVRKANCMLDLNLQRFELEASTVCLLVPGQIRRIKFAESAQAVVIRLPADFFYQLSTEIRFPVITRELHHIGRPLQVKLDTGTSVHIDGIVERMYSESKSDHVTRNEVLAGWLKILLMYVKRNMDTRATVPTQSRDTELACKFMELVSRAYATKKMVADYASELMVTPNYLNQIVKRVSGFPASHHIQQYLIMEAKRQAIQSCRSMKEIAYDLGFEDLAHFSKFFKNKSGTNFSSFKKSRLSVSA